MNKYQKIWFATGSVVFSLAFTVISANAATLSLSPSSQSVNVGDTFTVQVMLDTQGQPIDGVDLQALNYNPYNLQLIDADAVAPGVQIKAGGLMPNTVANSVDTTNGKIVFSQITNGGSTYTGSGVLATVTFKALVAGTANVKFDFTPGATTDSNVASQGNDILSSVVNGTFTINNPVTSNPGNGSPAVVGVTNNSTSSGSMTLAQLLALLNQLKAQLKALVLQAIARGIQLPPGLAASLGINPTTGASTGSTASSFTRNLTIGMSGADVLALQQYLNSHGFTVAASGPGSAGNEVTVFGQKTAAALAKFQAANGLPATGFFGALTRAKIATLQ